MYTSVPLGASEMLAMADMLVLVMGEEAIPASPTGMAPVSTVATLVLTGVAAVASGEAAVSTGVAALSTGNDLA